MSPADRDSSRTPPGSGEAGLPNAALEALDAVAVAVLRGPARRVELANERFTRMARDSAAGGLPFDPGSLDDAWHGRGPVQLRARPVLVDDDEQLWNFDLVPLPSDDPERRGVLIVGCTCPPDLEAAEAARSQARMLDAIMTYVPAGITVAEGGEVKRSSEFAKQLRLPGWSPVEKLTVDRLGEILDVRDPATGRRVRPQDLPLNRAASQGQVVRGAELLITVEGGAQLPIHCDAGPIRDDEGAVIGGVVVWQDIHQLKAAEAALKSALEAKEALLRELAHRVKNNFQMVSALLQLQAGDSADPALREGLQQAVWRIHALASIHERLYRREQFDGKVDLEVAVDDLCRNLHAAAGAAVRLELRLEPLAVSGDSGFPLLLIVNELLSSAFRRGLAEGGTVTVRLRRDRASGELSVTETGIAQDPASGREGRLGRSLVDMMARQIGGELNADAGGGLTIRFSI